MNPEILVRAVTLLGKVWDAVLSSPAASSCGRLSFCIKFHIYLEFKIMLSASAV